MTSPKPSTCVTNSAENGRLPGDSDEVSVADEHHPQDPTPGHARRRGGVGRRLRPPCCRPGAEPTASWVVLGAAVVANMMMVFDELVVSLAYRRVAERYGASMGQVGWVRAAWSVSLYGAGTLLTPAIERLGCRRVGAVCGLLAAVSLGAAPFLPTLLGFGFFYGVLSGVGCGGLFFTATTIIQLHFDQNRGLATGTAVLGFSASSVLAPVVIETLLDTYGLRGGLLLCGAIMANAGAAAMLYFPVRHKSHDPTRDQISETLVNHRDHEISESKSRRRSVKLEKVKRLIFNTCDSALVRNPYYVCFCVYGCLANTGYEGMYAQGPNRLKEVGMSSGQAAYLMSVIGVVNIILRVFSSVLMNFSWLNEMAYTVVGLACGALGSLLLALATGYPMCVLGMVAFGGYEGITNTLRSLLLVRLVGVPMFNRANSLYFLLQVPVCLLAPPLTGTTLAGLGYLYDRYGTYAYGFYMTAAMGGTAFVILVTMVIVRANVQASNVPTKSSQVLEEPPAVEHLVTAISNGVNGSHNQDLSTCGGV